MGEFLCQAEIFFVELRKAAVLQSALSGVESVNSQHALKEIEIREHLRLPSNVRKLENMSRSKGVVR